MELKNISQAFFAKNNRHHLVWMALILVFCFAIFAFVGLKSLPGTQAVYKPEIVSDNTDVPTVPLAKGEVFKQMIFVEGPLYGIVLHPITGGKTLNGTLTVQLMDHFEKEVIFTNSVNLADLKENQPLNIVFGGMINASENGGEEGTSGIGGSWYCLRLTSAPNTPKDAPAFYKSNGFPQYYYDTNLAKDHYSSLAAFTLNTGAGWVQEMLALQYLIDVTGPFLPPAYCFFAAFLTVFLLFLYALIFVFKAPIHLVFLLCAICLGFVFAFLIPPRAAPDEYAHISSAYHYANRLLGKGQEDEFGKLWVRAGDQMKLWNYDTTSIGLFAYRDLAQNLFAKAPKAQGEYIPARAPFVFFGQLAVPALGVFFARLFGLGRIGMLLFGRFFNLAFYSVLVSRAIKQMPFAKPLLFSVALLPMSLQLAASFSYDTYVMALAFYLVAFCLNCRFNKKSMGAKHIATLCAVGILLAPAKSVYLPMLLLIFLVKPGQFSSKKICIATRCGILFCGGVLWLMFTASSLMVSVGAAPKTQNVQAAPAPPVQVLSGAKISVAQPFGGSLSVLSTPVLPAAALGTPPQLYTRLALANAAALPPNTGHTNFVKNYKGDVLPNGDAVRLYSFTYIAGHLPQTVRILLYTFWQQGPLWLQGLVGGRLGEVIATDIELSWALVFALVFVLFLSGLCQPQDRRILPPKLRLMFLGIALFSASATILASLTWTPLNYLSIFGIQGRYFLPILPLVLLALRGNNLRFTKPVWQKLAFLQAVLVVLCQLNAFYIIVNLK